MRLPTLLRPAPSRFVVSGVAWLLFGAYLIVAGWAEWLEELAALDTIAWPVLGLASIVAGMGLLFARPFTRGLIVFLAGLGFTGPVVFLHAVSYPAVLQWWPVIALALFFAWSAILVVALWPSRPSAHPAAG